MEESKDYKRYYTNTTGIELTNTDVSLCVNYKENDKVEKLCKITFSPEQAKLTMIMLERAISEFEKNTREIKVDANKITSSKGENINGGEK